jgi:hypothetical protein
MTALEQAAFSEGALDVASPLSLSRGQVSLGSQTGTPTETVEKPLRLDPNSAITYSNKALALMGLEHMEEAQVACERASILM